MQDAQGRKPLATNASRQAGNEDALHGKTAPGKRSSQSPALQGQHRALYEVLFFITLALAGLGMALTNASPALGYRYWAVTTVLFAIAAMGATGVRTHARNEPMLQPLALQGLQWLIALLALFIVHMLMQAGRMTFPAAGFVTMLIVGLSLALDGLYQTGWRFALLGLAIMTMVLVIAWFAVYLWLIVFGAIILWIIAILVERQHGPGPIAR